MRKYSRARSGVFERFPILVQKRSFERYAWPQVRFAIASLGLLCSTKKAGAGLAYRRRTPALQLGCYVSDHPTSVNAINIASAPRLISDSVFPLPSSKLRVSALQQSTVATIKIAPHEMAH